MTRLLLLLFPLPLLLLPLLLPHLECVCAGHLLQRLLKLVVAAVVEHARLPALVQLQQAAQVAHLTGRPPQMAEQSSVIIARGKDRKVWHMWRRCAGLTSLQDLDTA